MTLDREKLAKVASLLASDKMGERAAAAAKATAILQRAGMTWEEALRPVPGRQTVVLLPADTAALDAEIARLRAALAESDTRRTEVEARCAVLSRQLQAERSVFWREIA
ncbi:hypothetical protein [Aureimonas leprariae]|uniref:Uncharacterized protein n=1 Tax=Plantimonas leprariae TaxID=2615207 RepID=A0A7V7TUW9_9HYPH|nr:hypothetical protein [Aureimonas leprariae]KAB0676716.1 hypothetical protein F6X38_20665 [Aureimonas leprariae]